MTKRIGFMVGSLRKESFNKKIAEKLIDLLPEGFEGEIIDWANLPVYREEYDQDEPVEYKEFRGKLDSYDGIIFQTAEYNRGMPGGLKNAIDVGSRPWGKNRWAGKPAAVFSSSIGALSGALAANQLRQVVSFLNMPTLTQPEVYLGNIGNSFDEEGKMKKDLEDFLKTAVAAYVDHFNAVVK